MTPSTKPSRHANSDRLDPGAVGARPGESAEEAKQAHRELVNFLEGAPESARGWATEQMDAVKDAYAASSHSAGRRAAPLLRVVIGAIALAVSAGVVVGVYDLGGSSSGKASPRGGSSEQHGLSSAQRARVSQLMERLKARPKDAKTLIALGDTFFEAHEYNSAGGWMKRAVQADPKNVTARLALGAAEFNIGDAADARSDWQRVIAADPKNVEAYYDLGFLYVSKDPPDMASAKKYWDEVLKLAPRSAVAKTIAMHIKGLEKK